MRKFVRDEKRGRILDRAVRLFRGSFPELAHVKLLLVWRVDDKPVLDLHSGVTVRLLPRRERDLYGYDVEVCASETFWKAKGRNTCMRAVFHALAHIQVELDENLEPIRDEDGRVVIRVAPHDIDVQTFSVELEKFGIAPDYAQAVRRLVSVQQRSETGGER